MPRNPNTATRKRTHRSNNEPTIVNHFDPRHPTSSHNSNGSGQNPINIDVSHHVSAPQFIRDLLESTFSDDLRDILHLIVDICTVFCAIALAVLYIAVFLSTAKYILCVIGVFVVVAAVRAIFDGRNDVGHALGPAVLL